MINAKCNIMYLPRQVVWPDGEQGTTHALATRCELGFLTGQGIHSFVVIEPDVEGRNYLWAEMKPYTHMVRCETLDEALRQAIAFMQGE